uniref:Uncharacterized protein n=1 Tax=Coccidioides posadasii RMSCC 3488 TaxID=454284 RepID=A0A0J6HYT0_COCPO|nr:hypothetical protein CPAG_00469 [Coccidioides posadasii RMSCC 3488]
MNFDCFQELYSARTEIYVAYCKYISDGFIPPGIAEAGSITRSLLLAAVAPKSWLLGFDNGGEKKKGETESDEQKEQCGGHVRLRFTRPLIRASGRSGYVFMRTGKVENGNV